MSWTKRQIIEQAFDELALADYNFDITPDEFQSAARRLDAQMATWNSLGLGLPYAFGGDPDSIDIDAESGLPMVAIEATYLALAVKTAASKGKALSQSTKTAAKAAYDALASSIARAEVQEQQYRAGTPKGAGRKPWRTVTQPFITQPDSSAMQIAPDGGLNLTGS